MLGAMDLNRAIVTGDAVRRARAMAEFEEWSFVADFHAARIAEIDRSDQMPLSKELARREVTLEIAQAMHASERQVWAMVGETEILRKRVPAAWEAFAVGDIDGPRASAIAASSRLIEPARSVPPVIAAITIGARSVLPRSSVPRSISSSASSGSDSWISVTCSSRVVRSRNATASLEASARCSSFRRPISELMQLAP